MKLSELIHKVDRSDHNSSSADIDDFSRALDLDNHIVWHQEFDKRVKGHFLVRWHCTDTWVGYRVYFMDDEPIAISRQRGRKCDEEIEFVSLEAAQKVKDFIKSLEGEEEFNPTLADMDEEITKLTYTVSFSSQLLVDEGTWNGQPVKVKRKCYGYGNSPEDMGLEMDELDVIMPNGELKRIKCSDFIIPMHLKKEESDEQQ